MKKNTGFQASSMRKILVSIFFVVLLALIGAYYLGLRAVKDYAVEVTQTTKDVTASSSKVENLKDLELKLNQTKASVDKADRMFAPANGYQTQVVNDLRRYATAAGIGLQTTDFANQAGETETRSFSISLANPVDYSQLLRFIELVETSLPKMEISELTIARSANSNASQVNVEKLTLKVYVK